MYRKSYFVSLQRHEQTGSKLRDPGLRYVEFARGFPSPTVDQTQKYEESQRTTYLASKRGTEVYNFPTVFPTLFSTEKNQNDKITR